MKRWIGFAARLYPRRWRRRYGQEFDALLEETRPGWREFADVIRGAIHMQTTNGASYLRWAGALAGIGAIGAAGMSFREPSRYTSSAVVQLRGTPQGASTLSAAALDQHLAYQLQMIRQQVLTQSSLVEMIARPSLNLYSEERKNLTVEAVIGQMRQRDLVIRPLSAGKSAVTVAFSYPDRDKAQAAVRAVVAKLIEETEAKYKLREEQTQTVWRRSTPIRERLEVLDPASPPQPAGPHRLAWAAAGLGAGLICGLLIASLLRRPKGTLQVAGCAAAGCALACGISLTLPLTYRSTSVLRITPSLDPSHIAREGGFLVSAPGVIEHLKEKVLAPGTGNQASIRLLDSANPEGAVFTIEYSHRDPYRAQAMVRKVVSRFMEEYVREERTRANSDPELARVSEYKAGQNLEVLDRPSLPAVPLAPNRLAVATAGLLAGLLLGVAALYYRGQRPAGGVTRVSHL